jgi:predicted transcriptional regulator
MFIPKHNKTDMKIDDKRRPKTLAQSRAIEVKEMRAQGMSKSEIADALGITASGVGSIMKSNYIR